MIVYTNDGIDFRPVEDGYELADGEIAFDGYATDAELAATFPGYAVKAQERLQRKLVAAVQKHMDEAARARGYDNIFSASTYADESAVPKFQTEGQAYREWRSLVWAYCYAQMDAVLAGERATPTTAELIAELPALVLPE